MEKNSTVKKIIIGTGVAALAAGIYFLYCSENALKNRKKAKAWILKAKGEAIERLEGLSEMGHGK